MIGFAIALHYCVSDGRVGEVLEVLVARLLLLERKLRSGAGGG